MSGVSRLWHVAGRSLDTAGRTSPEMRTGVWLLPFRLHPRPGSPSSPPCLSPLLLAMDAASIELRPLYDWDENDVHLWLSKLGFPQYEQQVRGMSASLSVDTSSRPTLSQSTTYPAMSSVSSIQKASRRWALLLSASG